MSGGGPAGEDVVGSEDVVKLVELGTDVVEEAGAVVTPTELCEGKLVDAVEPVGAEVGELAEELLAPPDEGSEPAGGVDREPLLLVVVDDVDTVPGLCFVGCMSPLVLKKLVMLLELEYPKVTVEVAVNVGDGIVILEKVKEPGPKVKTLVV